MNIKVSEDTKAHVTVAICTFRRASLFETLSSLLNLNDRGNYNLSVVVVDNDETDSLRETVAEFSKTYSLPLKYVHAPSKNISIARNGALNAVATRWLLFIDDDEIAHKDWLKNIMSMRSDLHVVIGQCQAIYSDEQPGWLSRCDFHSNRLSGRPENAYTSNALIDMDFVKKHDFSFREELGLTGGEDTIFFRQIFEAGGVIEYCPSALVYEPVPQGRASMSWVKTRKFRAGQTHGLLCKDFDSGAYRLLFVTAGSKMIVSAIMALVTMPGTDSSRRWWARAYLHAGAVRYRLKPTILEEYR